MNRPGNRAFRVSTLKKLVALGVVSEAIYLLIAWAGQSLHVEGVGDWSLLTILGLFSLAFFAYLWALKIAVGSRQNRQLLLVIGFCAATFRLTLLLTDPIAELDIYRYMWDGQVCNQGVDPYRYSPGQVLATSRGTFASAESGSLSPFQSASIPPDLAILSELIDRSPQMAEILRRVHFAELPTIYPPISQVVFTLASLVVPDDASILVRMVIFKTSFVLFDLLTFVLVVLILRDIGQPVGWSLAYGWCPLVIKEFANSGHLDAVAVFFTTLAVWLAVRACFPLLSKDSEVTKGSSSRIEMVLAIVALSFGIGAKLYPLVLVPLFLFSSLRRFGWRITVVSALVFVLVTSVLLWPMVPKRDLAELPDFRFPSTSDELPPLLPPHIGTEARDPSESLRVFLSEWEMNDFIFLIGMENIRPTHQLPEAEIAWFSVVPENWRKPVRELTGWVTGVEPSRTPFFFSRAITSAMLLVLAIVLAWRAARRGSPQAFLEAAFLTIAWFWLILPTGNPWYWTWAVPLLPFARGRVWLALSGLVMIYYLRFWLMYHYPDPPLLGTGYNGPLYFDYVVTWLEFGPWFAVLFWLWLKGLKDRRLKGRLPAVRIE